MFVYRAGLRRAAASELRLWWRLAAAEELAKEVADAVREAVGRRGGGLSRGSRCRSCGGNGRFGAVGLSAVAEVVADLGVNFAGRGLRDLSGGREALADSCGEGMLGVGGSCFRAGAAAGSQQSIGY